jgi:hypothetical protein
MESYRNGNLIHERRQRNPDYDSHGLRSLQLVKNDTKKQKPERNSSGF